MTEDSLDVATAAVREGRFRDAKTILAKTAVSLREGPVARNALLAHVADQLGETERARLLAESVNTSKEAGPRARALAYSVLGRLSFQERRYESAVDWFHRAIRSAQDGGDTVGEAEYPHVAP